MIVLMFLLVALMLGWASDWQSLSNEDRQNARMGAILAFGMAVLLTVLEVAWWP